MASATVTILSLAVFAAVLVLLLRALRQSSVVRRLEASAERPLGRARAVAVIIPARNEAAKVGACLDRVLHQSYPSDRLRVMLVDDESEDATGAIARDMAERDGRLSVVRAPRLPSGWTGKGHACWVGVRNLRNRPEWLCFLDADVTIHEDLLRRAVAAADAERLDLLSLAPTQSLESFAERLIMPCGFYLLAFIQDLRKTEAPGSDEVAATGMFMLVRRTAYEAVGGHRAVRSAISEDTALARTVKRAGGKVAMWDGGGLLETRMYSGWAALRAGLGKNLVDLLGGRAATIATAVLGLLLAWGVVLMPVANLLTMSGKPLGLTALGLALGAAALALAFHVAGAAHFRIPLWYGLLFPLGYTAGAVIAFDSVRQRMRGQVVWKGRSYAPPVPSRNAAPGGG
jgi:chlorobactene glucosyltransferase